MEHTPTPPGTAEPDLNPYPGRWVDAYLGATGYCGDWNTGAGWPPERTVTA